MDNVLDDIGVQIRQCENASKMLEREPFGSQIKAVLKVCNDVGDAWSKSWIGYHTCIYYRDFQCPPPGVVFDSRFGPDSFASRTSGEWYQYNPQAVADMIYEVAGKVSQDAIEARAKDIGRIFDECKEELLASIFAIISHRDDPRLRELAENIQSLVSHLHRDSLVKAQMPRQMMSSDHIAMQQLIQGTAVCPPHIAIQSIIAECISYGKKISELATLARQTKLYLEKRLKMEGATLTKTSGKIFIGHGRSPVWKDLKDFIQDRLRLPPDEYDLQSSAGMAISERIQQMLDEACFAFIVMTGEDEHADATLHARENVRFIAQSRG